MADPRRDEHPTVEQYLAAWDLEYALRRDARMTPAETAAAGQALAECQGVPWREEWVRR